VLKMRRGKWVAAALAAGLMVGFLGIALAAGGGNGRGSGTASSAHGQSGGSNGRSSGHGTHPHTPVLICHHTGSSDNPVVTIVTDDDAIIAHHEHHDGDLIITSNVPAASDKATQRAMCGLSAPTGGGGSNPGGQENVPGALSTPPPLTG